MSTKPASFDLVPTTEALPADRPRGDGIVSGVSAESVLRAAGIILEPLAGTIPTIEFHVPGESFVGVFHARTEPNEPNQKFMVLHFALIDPWVLARTLSVESSIVGRAQMIESFALKEWASGAKPGDVVKITYGGEQPTRRGLAPLKLLSVQRVVIPHSAAPDATLTESKAFHNSPFV